ncbi:MAG: ABC transporter substrate-binding protein [Candidatus Bathyarchaeia archaeon]
MKTPPNIVVIAVVLITIIAASSFIYVYVFAPKKVRIGFLQGDLHQLAFFVAVEKSLFKNAGIEFDYIPYPNGVSEMDGFAANAINVGYLGAAPATFKRIRTNMTITIVASANAEGSAIIAGLGTEINTISQLVGKRVAIPNTATVQDVLLRIALSQYGLSYANLSDQFPIVNIAPATMPERLRSGEFDAYVAWEPWAAAAIVNGYGKAIANSFQIWPEHPCCILAVSQDFLNRNLDLVKKIVAVHINATRYILNFDNHADVVEIAKKWTGQNETIITQAISNIKFLYQPDVQGIKTWLNYLIQFGLLQESEIPGGIDQFVSEFVNTEIVQEVE